MVYFNILQLIFTFLEPLSFAASEHNKCVASSLSAFLVKRGIFLTVERQDKKILSAIAQERLFEKGYAYKILEMVDNVNSGSGTFDPIQFKTRRGLAFDMVGLTENEIFIDVNGTKYTLQRPYKKQVLTKAQKVQRGLPSRVSDLPRVAVVTDTNVEFPSGSIKKTVEELVYGEKIDRRVLDELKLGDLEFVAKKDLGSTRFRANLYETDGSILVANGPFEFQHGSNELLSIGVTDPDFLKMLLDEFPGNVKIRIQDQVIQNYDEHLNSADLAKMLSKYDGRCLYGVFLNQMIRKCR